MEKRSERRKEVITGHYALLDTCFMTPAQHRRGAGQKREQPHWNM